METGKYLAVIILLVLFAALYFAAQTGFLKSVSPLASPGGGETPQEKPAQVFGVQKPETPAGEPAEGGFSETGSDFSANINSALPAPAAPKVVFGSPRLSGFSDTSFSAIPLFSQLAEGERLNITGWHIKARRGDLIIPQAVEVYDPSGFSGAKDIILKPGDQVEIYSSASAFGGRNLKTNKCLGYLPEAQNSNSPLSLNCPFIEKAEIRHLSGACQNYISSLSSCRLPDDNIFTGQSQDDTDCRIFLSTINYAGCFNRHRADADFLSNFWAVWVNQQILDLNHDFLQLVDKSGKVIATYEY